MSSLRKTLDKYNNNSGGFDGSIQFRQTVESEKKPPTSLNILLVEIMKFLNWISLLNSSTCNLFNIQPTLMISLSMHLYQLAFMTTRFLNIEELKISNNNCYTYNFNNIECILNEILYHPLNYSWKQLTDNMSNTDANVDDMISKHYLTIKSIRLIRQFSMEIYHFLHINPLHLIKWLSNQHQHYQSTNDNISFYTVINHLFNLFISNLPVPANTSHIIDPIWSAKFDLFSLTLEQDIAQLSSVINKNLQNCKDCLSVSSSSSSSSSSPLDLRPKSYYNKSIRCFMNPLTRSLYTLFLCTIIDDQLPDDDGDDNKKLDELIMTSLIELPSENNHHHSKQTKPLNIESLNYYGKLLITMLTHSNILVSINMLHFLFSYSTESLSSFSCSND